MIASIFDPIERLARRSVRMDSMWAMVSSSITHQSPLRTNFSLSGLSARHSSLKRGKRLKLCSCSVQCGVEAETRTIAGNGERDVTMSDQEIASIYGLPGTVNIYTAGEIEYDFNAVTGCSGRLYFYSMRTNRRLCSSVVLVRSLLPMVGLTQSWWTRRKQNTR
jgi:hypothetical protein